MKNAWKDKDTIAATHEYNNCVFLFTRMTQKEKLCTIDYARTRWDSQNIFQIYKALKGFYDLSHRLVSIFIYIVNIKKGSQEIQKTLQVES